MQTERLDIVEMIYARAHEDGLDDTRCSDLGRMTKRAGANREVGYSRDNISQGTKGSEEKEFFGVLRRESGDANLDRGITSSLGLDCIVSIHTKAKWGQ